MDINRTQLLGGIIAVGGLLLLGLYASRGYAWWLYPLPIFAILYGAAMYRQYRGVSQ